MFDLNLKLKKLREEHHYSQKVVASRIMCSPSIISSYETGERQPSLTNLVALSYLYHVSTDYLLGKTESPRDIDLSNMVDVSKLTDEQIKVIQFIITDMEKANRKN